jgi:hypothetical protein
VRVPVSKAGYRRLRRIAAAWPQACWAIEGARGLGAPTSRMADDLIRCRMCRPNSLAVCGYCLPVTAARPTRPTRCRSVSPPRAPPGARGTLGRGRRGAAGLDRAPRGSSAHPHPDHQPAARTAHQARPGPSCRASSPSAFRSRVRPSTRSCQFSGVRTGPGARSETVRGRLSRPRTAPNTSRHIRS